MSLPTIFSEVGRSSDRQVVEINNTTSLRSTAIDLSIAGRKTQLCPRKSKARRVIGDVVRVSENLRSGPYVVGQTTKVFV